jgi:hypothetical protein
VVAAKLDKLLPDSLKNGFESIDGGLMWCVRLVQLDGFFGSHGAAFIEDE